MGVCKKSRQCQRLEMKMMKTLLIFTLAALASALPLDEERQCEGTLCHAGCCPMQGWYCCEDNMNCAATAEECPPFSSSKYLGKMAKDAWCEGTNCPAGCCPEANWFCCPDFQYCAAVAEECPETKKLFNLY